MNIMTINASSGQSRLLLLLLWLFALQGCRSIDLEADFELNETVHSRIIDQTADAFPEIDPLQLSAEIKQLIDGYIREYDSEETKVEKLQEILYSEEYLNLQYADSKTHTAIEAFEAKEGNCLSAMNLYVAMARYVGVDASFQTVEVQPSWDRRGGLLVLSRHINASGQFNVQRRYVVDFTPEIALQQLTSQIVSDRFARGLYFNNLGVEAMVASDYAMALVYFKNALFLEPELSIAWNNIGAAYNRLGSRELAEYSYQMSFNVDGTNATAVNNLAKFYRTTGNERLAREYEVAIERFNNRNPYFHYARGQIAFYENDFDLAQSSFQRAIRLKEEEPDFYLALAQIYKLRGNESRAENLRESAEQLIAQNAEIYQPSDDKLRIIDSSSILRDSSPSISIRFD